MTFDRRRTLIGALVVLAALVGAVSPSGANNRAGDNGHWSDGDRSTAWVTIVDHTGSQWPVFAASIEWDRAANIVVTYKFGDCGGNGHCTSVDATQFSQSCHDNPGFAYTPEHPGTNHHTSDTFMLFNTRCNDRSDRVQRVFVCHEEGHVLGVGHEPQSNRQETCMAQAEADHPPFDEWEETPRAHDFSMLNNVIYDHND